MRISIVMATYNGARYLQEQLESFLYQTRMPDELIVCDDGSDDCTPEILESFKRHAPFETRVYFNETNLGYARNFEQALSLAQGDVILLSDQDDVWFCNKVTKIEQMSHEQANVFVFITDMVLTDAKLSPTPYTQMRNTLASGHTLDSFASGCASAIRREFLDLALPLPPDMAHDNWIHRLAVALNVRMVSDLPLQYYRRHGDNASHWLASKPQRIGRFNALRAHGTSDPRPAWIEEQERFEVAYRRIADSTDILEGIGLRSKQREAMNSLLRAIEDLEARVECLGFPRLRRLSHVLRLYRDGRYGRFSGWRSAMKDILRP